MNKPIVVLIHGLGRTQRSLGGLGCYLSQAGFKVIFHDYQSRRLEITDLVAELHNALTEIASQGNAPIHFVTHSLGGILLRAFLASRPTQHINIGRIVMLAPPNSGSEVIDFWRSGSKRRKFFQYYMGNVALSLHSDPDSLPNQLPLLEEYDIGIICGTRSADPWFNHLFSSAHDGKVSITSAKLHEHHALIKLPVTHTFMMNNAHVRAEILHFLQHAQFLTP